MKEVKKFQVQLDLLGSVEFCVDAESLQDALDQTNKRIKEKPWFQADLEIVDACSRITGVLESDFRPMSFEVSDADQ